MYYVVNIEKRTIATYRDGTRTVYASKDLADQQALTAQEMTGNPYTVLPISATVVNALGRAPAPWYR